MLQTISTNLGISKQCFFTHNFERTVYIQIHSLENIEGSVFLTLRLIVQISHMTWRHLTDTNQMTTHICFFVYISLGINWWNNFSLLFSLPFINTFWPAFTLWILQKFWAWHILFLCLNLNRKRIIRLIALRLLRKKNKYIYKYEEWWVSYILKLVLDYKVLQMTIFFPKSVSSILYPITCLIIDFYYR